MLLEASFKLPEVTFMIKTVQESLTIIIYDRKMFIVQGPML